MHRCTAMRACMHKGVVDAWVLCISQPRHCSICHNHPHQHFLCLVTAAATQQHSHGQTSSLGRAERDGVAISNVDEPKRQFGRFRQAQKACQLKAHGSNLAPPEACLGQAGSAQLSSKLAPTSPATASSVYSVFLRSSKASSSHVPRHARPTRKGGPG